MTTEELKAIEKMVIRHSYPPEIIGFEQASYLIGISVSGLHKRIERGTYVEGKENGHFYKKNKKVAVFFRDRLLNSNTINYMCECAV